MKGTEKQIAWAEEIKATYLAKMEEAASYLRQVIETGSTRVDEYPELGIKFVELYHREALYDTVDAEMKTSDLYKAFSEAQRGTPEKKAAGKAYRTAVAREALARLEKAVAERSANEDARFWIESRPI